MTHPITPPPELVEQLEAAICMYEISLSQAIAEAYAAGADAELEACCEWLRQNVGRWEIPEALHDARRPKPPSLKQRITAAIKDGDERTALLLLNEVMPDD